MTEVLHRIAWDRRVDRSPGRSPGEQTTKPPFGGLSEAIQIAGEFGAGEGARTLDPDLGKVVVLFQLVAKAY